MKRITTFNCTPIGLLLALLLNLFFVSGRVAAQSDCRDNLTRAHLTRCDKYFQCVVLPSKRIIWVSKQCAEGLVYDNDHGQCVVPDLNWECALGEEESSTSVDDSADQENVYGLNNIEDYLARSDESSGAGVEEGEDEFGEATTEYPADSLSLSLASPERPDQEFSGDGTENSVAADTSTEAVEMPITPDQDGTVKSYLQRLTQLIDGFRKNGGSTATDITPDQLNSFVVMHKIKSNKNYDPSGTHVLPESGNILRPHLEYILKKQYSLNSLDQQPQTTTTTTTTASPVRRRIIHIIRPYHQPEPEDSTNIRVSSQLGNGNETGTGSNSQIVVNRPEGSVLFNIARPSPASEAGTSGNSQNRDPSFSQDTLKSVLELSKQLVAHQKYLSQKPNYLPPVVQPVYYTVPMQMMQSANNQNYFNGEAVPVNPASENKTALKPEKVHKRPVRIHNQNHIQNSGTYYEGQYHQLPLQQGYSRPSKYSTEDKHEQETTQYVPLRPINPYEPQYQNNYHYNSNNQPFGYYNSFPTASQNQQNYNSGSQSGYNHPQDNHQYYNSDPDTYNPHRPPYYDASGLGQSSGNNNYYNPSANFKNSQFSYNPPQNYYSPNYYHPLQTHAHNDEFESDDEESAEDQEGSKENTKSLEPTEKPSPTPSTPLSSLQQISQQLLLNNVGNKNKIVGINGNYMSFDTYKETIAPLLNNNNDGGESNVEIVPCTLGVRQANASDCTRYYVCNPKDGQLLGYTCPPYTAFNELSRICDANSYAACNPGLITAKYTIQENKRLQYEAQKTLQEAKRIRDQALQAQYLTIQAQTTERPQFMDIPDAQPILHKIKQKLKGTRPQPTAIAARPQTPLQSLGQRRRKYKCTDAGQAIPDVLSGHKYFMCVRDAAGKFKRRSMSCSKGLMFCSKRRMCTLKSRC